MNTLSARTKTGSPEPPNQNKKNRAMPSSLPPESLHAATREFNQIRALPFPIYLSSADGFFLRANAEAVEFFAAENEGELLAKPILSFYADPTEREVALQRLRRGPRGEWQKDFSVKLRMEPGGKTAKIRFVSMPFFDERGDLIAMLNMINQPDEKSWFSELDDRSKDGHFELDDQLRIEDCNAAFAQMLGHEDRAAPIGSSFLSLLLDEKWTREAFVEALRSDDEARLELLYFQKKDGSLAVLRLHFVPKWDESGAFRWTLGIAHDQTLEQVTEWLPFGFFMIEQTVDGDRVRRCNDLFAQIFGYEKARDMIDMDINKFHVSEESRLDYLNALRDEAKKGEPLKDFLIKLKDRGGNELKLINNTRLQPDGKTRVGRIYDISQHGGLNRRMLEQNFSAVLHTYIATINGLKKTFSSLIEAHGADFLKPNARSVDRARAIQELRGQHKIWKNELEQIRQTIGERAQEVLFAQPLEAIERLTEKPDRAWDNDKDTAVFSRMNLIKIQKQITELRRGGQLPRELLRSARVSVAEMLRLSSVVTLSIGLEEINERIPDFHFFRDYLLRGKSWQLQMVPINLVALVWDVSQQLSEFAASQHVAIREQLPATASRFGSMRIGSP